MPTTMDAKVKYVYALVFWIVLFAVLRQCHSEYNAAAFSWGRTAYTLCLQHEIILWKDHRNRSFLFCRVPKIELLHAILR